MCFLTIVMFEYHVPCGKFRVCSHRRHLVCLQCALCEIGGFFSPSSLCFECLCVSIISTSGCCCQRRAAPRPVRLRRSSFTCDPWMRTVRACALTIPYQRCVPTNQKLPEYSTTQILMYPRRPSALWTTNQKCLAQNMFGTNSMQSSACIKTVANQPEMCCRKFDYTKIDISSESASNYWNAMPWGVSFIFSNACAYVDPRFLLWQLFPHPSFPSRPSYRSLFAPPPSLVVQFPCVPTLHPADEFGPSPDPRQQQRQQQSPLPPPRSNQPQRPL